MDDTHISLTHINGGRFMRDLIATAAQDARIAMSISIGNSLVPVKPVRI